MSATDIVSRKRAFKLMVRVVLLSALVVTVAIAALFICTWNRNESVSGLVGAFPELKGVNATSDLCKDPLCEEGWRTDFGNYLEFASQGEAQYWEVVLGNDGRRWKNIVLDMRTVDLTFDQRRHAIDILYSSRDWS